MSDLNEWMEKAKTSTPIGGITPGGNKKVAKDRYVKVGGGGDEPKAPTPRGKHTTQLKDSSTRRVQQQLRQVAKTEGRKHPAVQTLLDELIYRRENVQAATAINSIEMSNNAYVESVTPTKVTFRATAFSAEGVKRDGHPVKMVKKGKGVSSYGEPEPSTYSIAVKPNPERKYEVADAHVGDMVTVRTLDMADERAHFGNKRVEIGKPKIPDTAIGVTQSGKPIQGVNDPIPGDYSEQDHADAASHHDKAAWELAMTMPDRADQHLAASEFHRKRAGGAKGQSKTLMQHYEMKKSGSLEDRAQKFEISPDAIRKADDGKPGESLGETSTEELKATLKKLKPTDPGSQGRIKALKAELSKRTGPDFGGEKTEKAMTYTNLDDFLSKAEAPDFKTWIMGIAKKKPSGESTEKSMDIDWDDILEKGGGPFLGKRGGKWADAKHTIPWKESKHGQAQGKEVKSRGEGDKLMAEDLKLTIENEGQLHNQMESIRKNLVNKMGSGKYDHAQASTLWNYAVENGAKLYKKTFPGTNIDKDTKLAVARALSDQFHDEMVEGEHDHHLNKKNTKATGGTLKGKKDVGDAGTVSGSVKDQAEAHMESRWKLMGEKGQQGKLTKEQYFAANRKTVMRNIKEGGFGSAGLPGPEGYSDAQLAEKTKKSMEAPMSLEEYLEKSGKGGGLPTHEPKLGAPKSATVEGGSADGGNLDGVGKTSGSSDSASGPAIGAPGSAKKKLSEDDAEVEGQMKPHKKPIEGTTRKSLFPADQRDSVAQEHAAAVSRLHKSDDVYVGPDNHPLSAHATHASGDADAADLVKSEGFYTGGSPQVAPNRPIIEQGVLCKSVNANGCDETYSAALTACPGCGSGTVGHRHVPGGDVVGASPQILEKSTGPGSLLRRPPMEDDVKIG